MCFGLLGGSIWSDVCANACVDMLVEICVDRVGMCVDMGDMLIRDPLGATPTDLATATSIV